jgi:23S rRNA (uracil1939-C5)-methyltransferase
VSRSKKLPKLSGLEIIDISSDGRAVGRHENRVVFIPQLVPGDIVDVQVVRKRKSYFEAVVLDFIKKSDLRIEAFCSHFGTCGGCKWQNMSYEQQLIFKQKQVVEQLSRIGGLSFPEISTIIPSKKTKYYRNKLEYSFCDRRWFEQDEIDLGKEIQQIQGLGFHVPGRFDRVLQIEHCYLQESPSNEIRNFIHEHSTKHALDYYNPRLHTGLLRNLMIRITSHQQIMCVIIAAEFNKELIDLLDEVYAKFPNISSLQYIINDKKNDSIYDLEVHTYKGQDFIVEKLNELEFRIGAKSFFQTNTLQAERLYAEALRMAEISPNDIVYDLYSGAGSISLFLAKHAAKVIGVEIVQDAVNDAVLNAQLNHIKNAEFFCGDMKDVLTEDFILQHGKPDVLVLDPPRAGVHKDVLDVIQNVSPKRIVYVSCNPATQARDIALLGENWQIIEVQPVDMFPHTHHVENIVLLEKRG